MDVEQQLKAALEDKEALKTELLEVKMVQDFFKAVEGAVATDDTTST